jgi:hypothetical protein
MKEIDKSIREFTDRELLLFVVDAVSRIEQKTRLMEDFLSARFGDDFKNHADASSTPYDLRKTILEYHSDAEGAMESI